MALPPRPLPCSGGLTSQHTSLGNPPAPNLNNLSLFIFSQPDQEVQELVRCWGAGGYKTHNVGFVILATVKRAVPGIECCAVLATSPLQNAGSSR